MRQLICYCDVGCGFTIDGNASGPFDMMMRLVGCVI